jgi:LacI family transcriptional regulator
MANIKEVARESGVSTATVSYVLNNSPRAIRSDTRERVLRAARRLNYYPSAVARGLSLNRMNAIGVVYGNMGTSPVTDSYFGPLLGGILDVTMREHQNTTLYTGQFWLDARHSMKVYCDGRCDGLLIIAPGSDTDIVQSLRDAGVTFVVIGSHCEDPCVSSIDADDRAGSRALVRHLAKQGHRRIAFLPGTAAVAAVVERGVGHQEALSEFGIPYDPPLCPPGNFTQESAVERALDLMRLPERERPTAVFCANDVMALAVMRAFKKIGLRVPADVSVAGFDDIEAAAQSRPALTTVRQPISLLGERASDILLAQIRGLGAAGKKDLLPTELVTRRSTGPVPRR